MKVTVKVNGEPLDVPGINEIESLDELAARLEAACEAKYPEDQYHWESVDLETMHIELRLRAKQPQENPDGQTPETPV